MKRDFLKSICLLCIWNQFILLRPKFKQKLDEVEKEYDKAISKVFNQICLILNTRGVMKVDELTPRDKIYSGFKFILFIVIADIFIATIFDSLYQVMVCAFNFYMLVPSLFFSVIGLAGILSMFIPKRRFTIDADENVKTASRVITTSVYISIIAVDTLLIQIFYSLGAIVKNPSAHNLVYVVTANFLPCIVTICAICLSKNSACILGAVQKIKIELFFD